MIFGRNWPLSLDQITNGQSSLKVCFVFLPKSPIRARLIGQIHFLKMLKTNLPKSGNKPKNSANCEHSIFDLGDVEQGLPDKNKSVHFFSIFGASQFREDLLLTFSKSGIVHFPLF